MGEADKSNVVIVDDLKKIYLKACRGYIEER